MKLPPPELINSISPDELGRVVLFAIAYHIGLTDDDISRYIAHYIKARADYEDSSRH